MRKWAASTGARSSAGDLTTAVGAVLDRLGTLVRQADDLAPTVRTVELLDAVAALEHAQTLVALAQAKVLAALTVVEPLPYRPGNGLTAAVRLPPAEETTAYEVAATLRCSVSVARDRLATARALAGVTAAVSAATDGSLRWWQLRRTADAVVPMPAAARAEVDRRIAEDAAAGRCASRFAARLTRAVLAADPAQAAVVHDSAVADGDGARDVPSARRAGRVPRGRPGPGAADRPPARDGLAPRGHRSGDRLGVGPRSHAARRTPRSPTTSGRPGSAGSAPARDAHTPAPTWTTR